MTNTTIHPLLTELELASTNYQSDESKPSSIDILNHLIQSNVISVDCIRQAYQTLTTTKYEKSKSIQVDTTPTDIHKKSIDNQPACSTSTIITNENRMNHNNNNNFRRHVALHIYYDGGKYKGLAENVGVLNDETIERYLFEALVKTNLITNRETSNYSRCGRTDRGVSAAGQIVALHLKSAYTIDTSLDEDGETLLTQETLPNNSHDQLNVWVYPRNKKGNSNQSSNNIDVVSRQRMKKTMREYSYEKILNNLLPPDIRVLGWCPVSNEFSARFSATTRTYRYFFLPRNMNLQLIRESLQLFIGTHDFRNFCKMDVEKVSNFVRKILHADLIEEQSTKGICYIQIIGQAFLWHQIRCIVHVLFLIGNGYEQPNVITELLNVQKYAGKPSYPLADERPLVLHGCDYKNLLIGYSVSNLWNIMCQQEQEWEDCILAAGRIRNNIENLSEKSISVTDLKDFCLSRQRNKKKSNGLDTQENNLTINELDSTTISWGVALKYLHQMGLVPEPQSKFRDMTYVPLLQRSKGTTYEEKVASLQNSRKRLAKYTENMIKKKKSTTEDTAFYDRMIKEGGISM